MNALQGLVSSLSSITSPQSVGAQIRCRSCKYYEKCLLTSHMKHGMVVGGMGGRRDKRSLRFSVLETARETYFFLFLFFYPLFFRRSLRFFVPGSLLESFQSVELLQVSAGCPIWSGLVNSSLFFWR